MQATGGRQDSARESVSGFGRSAAGKATWAARKELEKYATVRYNQDGTIKVTDDWKSRGKVSIPKFYKPNAIVETQTVFRNGKIQIDRSIYDANGWLKEQIHSGDHNKPHAHKFGVDGKEPFHKHTFHRVENGIVRNANPFSLNEEEKLQHKDILWEAKP